MCSCCKFLFFLRARSVSLRSLCNFPLQRCRMAHQHKCSVVTPRLCRGLGSVRNPETATLSGELHAWSHTAHAAHTHELTEESASVFWICIQSAWDTYTASCRTVSDSNLEQKVIQSQACRFEKPPRVLLRKQQVRAPVIQLYYWQKMPWLHTTTYTHGHLHTHTDFVQAKHTISCTQSHIFWPKPSIFSACGGEEGEISVQKKREKGGEREREGGGSGPARKGKVVLLVLQSIRTQIRRRRRGISPHMCVQFCSVHQYSFSCACFFYRDLGFEALVHFKPLKSEGEKKTSDMEKCCNMAARTVDSCYFSFSSQLVLDVSLWACSTTLPLLPLKVYCMFVKFRDLPCKHQIAGDLQMLHSRCTGTRFVSEVKGTWLETIDFWLAMQWADFHRSLQPNVFSFVILSFFSHSTILARVKLYPATSSTGNKPPVGKPTPLPLLLFLSFDCGRHCHKDSISNMAT